MLTLIERRDQGNAALREIMETRSKNFKALNDTLKDNGVRDQCDLKNIVMSMINTNKGIYRVSYYDSPAINYVVLELFVIANLMIKEYDLKDPCKVQLDHTKSLREILEDCITVHAYVTYIKTVRTYVIQWLADICERDDSKGLILQLKSDT